MLFWHIWRLALFGLNIISACTALLALLVARLLRRRRPPYHPLQGQHQRGVGSWPRDDLLIHLFSKAVRTLIFDGKVLSRSRSKCDFSLLVKSMLQDLSQARRMLVSRSSRDG